jgi:hypothetical protein
VVHFFIWTVWTSEYVLHWVLNSYVGHFPLSELYRIVKKELPNFEN